MVETTTEMQSAKKVSFTVAECGEFHNMGELHENVVSVKEALSLFEQIPGDRMHGIPNIRLGYKQNRLERNIIKAISELRNHDELNISDQQYRFVKEKLERLGMLQSRNEELRDKNLEAVIEYIKELQKQNKSSKPRAVRDPKVKRISNSDTYKITSLGRDFLRLMKPVETEVC